MWLLSDAIYLLNENDELQDHAANHGGGESASRQLFIATDRRTTSADSRSMALVVALFDDQVHDSRAWFMHDALGSRELWAGYFFYRMTYFGDENSRDLSPVVVAGRILGVAMLAGATVYGIKRGGALVPLEGWPRARRRDHRLSGDRKARGVALPFLPGAEQILKPTCHIGQVAAELKQQIALEDYLQRMKNHAMLREAGGLVELAGEAVS